MSEGIPNHSQLRQLSPYKDKENIIRVGGRLGRSALPAETKHQILLPAKSLCRLIIADAHLKTFHGGIQLTKAYIRHKFWIPGLRTAVKSHINRCIVCFRFRAQLSTQLMGSLPPARTVAAHPFAKAGVDFAGPFDVRKQPTTGVGLRRIVTNHKRTTATLKCWVVVFVCMTTRAVHLDIAHGLSVEAFLEVFTRFISRRGQCLELWSDNGTNFVGTNNELSRVRKEWQGKFPQPQLVRSWHEMEVHYACCTPPGRPLGGCRKINEAPSEKSNW